MALFESLKMRRRHVGIEKSTLTVKKVFENRKSRFNDDNFVLGTIIQRNIITEGGQYMNSYYQDI